MSCIVPSQSNDYFKLWEYYCVKHYKDTLDDEELSSYIKHWYSKHKKHTLTNILDKYVHLRNQSVSNLVFSDVLKDGSSVLYHVKIPDDATLPQSCSVTVIDYSNSHYQETKFVSVWISKFMSLYIKEMNLIPFEDHDFDGKDIEYAIKVPEVRADYDSEISMTDIVMYKFRETVDDKKMLSI